MSMEFQRIAPLWEALPSREAQPAAKSQAAEGSVFADVFQALVDNVREAEDGVAKTEYLLSTGQLDKEDGRYVITEKGRRNSRICESSLPPSVRRHCDENLVKVNDALRRENQVRAQVMEREDGAFNLCLTLEDNTAPLLHLALLVPNREQAEAWAKTFQADPSALYLNIIQLLDRPKEVQNEA